MSLKGINPIEQHFEKVIAGVFAAGLLGVLAWQFVGKGNAVKVGTDEVLVDQAYPKIANAASSTRARLEQVNVPKPEGADAGAATIAQFDARYKGPVAPGKQLAAALDRAPTPISGGVSADKITTKLASFDPPAPSKPVAASFMATISPNEPQQHPDVAAVLPKAQPYDKAAVTVESLFDGTAIKAILAKDPGAGLSPIPKNWWSDIEQILGVELVRQKLGPDGKWGADEVVAAMPGRQAFATPVAQIANFQALREAARVATENASLVRRPEYYRTIFGEKWVPPIELRAQIEEQKLGGDDVSRFKAELERERKKLKDLEDKIAKAPVAPPPGGTPGGGGAPPPGSGGGKGGSGGGGGAGGGGGPPGGSPSLPPSLNRDALIRNRDSTLKKIADLEKRLRDLGENVGGTPDANVDQKPKQPAEVALLDNPSVRVWAHDVFAERGQTYRYKTVVLLTNPYFGHAAAMLPEQAPLAKSPVARSAASEWSDPVHVEPETYWFVTSASSDDAITRVATAKAEVYQFKWGFWRRGSATLEPGDSIEAEIKIPDLSKLAAAMPQPQGQPPAPPPGIDPPPGSGGSGKGRPGSGGTPGGRGGGDPGGGLPPPRTPPGEAPKPGEGVTFNVVQVSSPSVMLGVAMTPAAVKADDNARGGNMEQVFLRDERGVVVVRLPREERESAEYLRVSHSAERGEKELEVAPTKPKTPQPPPGGGGRNGGGRDN